MNNIVEHLIDCAVSQHSDKFVGTPTNVKRVDFHFESKVNLPEFRKSNITTVNPIK